VSADSVALPRVRARKRKRRPMNKRERQAVWMAGVHATLTVLFLLFALLAMSPARWIGFDEVCFLLFWSWVPMPGNPYRILVNYIVNGFRDE